MTSPSITSNNSNGGRKAKLPRSCATCPSLVPFAQLAVLTLSRVLGHARKVKCDLLRVCTACKRHARSTGKNEADIICVYSIPPPPEPVHDGNVSSSSESSIPLQTRRRERQLDDEDIDYDFSASGDSTGNRTSKRRRRATAAALASLSNKPDSQSYIPKGMGCGRDPRRPDDSDDYYPSQYRHEPRQRSYSESGFFLRQITLHCRHASLFVLVTNRVEPSRNIVLTVSFFARIGPIDYSLSSPPPNEFLPTPVASPTALSTFLFPPQSMSRNVSMTLIDNNSCLPFFPSLSRRMSKPTSASLNLAPFDFNTFHAQPYDSPIGDFNFDFVAADEAAPLPLQTPMLETRGFFTAIKPPSFEVPGEAYPSPAA